MAYLSNRLQAIHDMLPKGVIADIGSDHGKLMIALFKSGKLVKGYAVENKKGPYQRLVKALEKEELIDKIIPLFSDGLDDIPPEVKHIVLAGMGGDLIIEILKKHPEKLKYLSTIVVDAHGAVAKVREEISQMGFAIAEEKIIKEDDKFYEIIKFIKADIAAYSSEDLEFGPMLRTEKSVAFKEKYTNRIHEIDVLLTKDLPSSRIEELLKEKNRIESIL